MVPSGALTSAPVTRWKSVLPLVPAIALCAVAIWEIAASARAGAWEPTEADWTAASEAVRQGHRPGDLIVFAPDWIDPVGRMQLGELITIEMAARMDAARYPVIWEISARGARAAETRGLPVDWEQTFGELRVRRFVQEPADVVTDFVAEAGRARPGGNSVGRPRVSLEEVGFEPHRCIRIVPRPGQTATLTFRDVELGARLVGYVGLADVFTRRDVRDPGRLDVVVNGEIAATATAGVDDGWIRFEAETSPGKAVVELRATAVGPTATDRRICVAAEARR